MIKEAIKDIIIVIAITTVILFVGALFEKAMATTSQEQCEIKGGVWTGEYCAPREMTDEEIVYARFYTAKKEKELREIKK